MSRFDEQVIQRGYEAFKNATDANSAHWNTIRGLLADDVVLYDYESPGPPPPKVGVNDVLAELHRLRGLAADPYTYGDPRSTDGVVVGLDDHPPHTDEAEGVHNFEDYCVDLFKVAGGKVTEIHYCVNHSHQHPT